MFNKEKSSSEDQGQDKKIANSTNENYDNFFNELDVKADQKLKKVNKDKNQEKNKYHLNKQSDFSDFNQKELKVNDFDVHHMPDKFLKPEKKEKSQKNIFVILAIALLIIVVLAVGIFAFFALREKEGEPVEVLDLTEKNNIEIEEENVEDLDLKSAEGRDSKRVEDVLNIRSALSFYYDDVNKYPYSLSSLKKYLSPVPQNPSQGGEEYNYELKDNGSNYILTFVLEEGTGLGNLILESDKYQLDPNFGISAYQEPELEPEFEPEPELEPEAEPNSALLPIPDKGPDDDNDGLTNTEELLFDTKFVLPDSDFDGYNDGEELSALYDPLNDGGILANSDSITVYSNEIFSYSILYPSKWSALESSSDFKEVVFYDDENGDFFKIQVEDNPQNLTIRNWYRYFSASDNTDNLEDFDNKNILGLKTEDGLNIYIAQGDKVYIISYIIVNTEELNYFKTFEMFTNSFRILSDL